MARTRRTKKAPAEGELDPARWAYAVFALLGFFAAWILAHAIEDGWALVWSIWPQLARPEPLWANVAGVAVAATGAVIAARRRSWFQFVAEVVVEISQVTWPTRAEVRAATGVVIVLTAICSVILAGMDMMWSAATDWLYGV